MESKTTKCEQCGEFFDYFDKYSISKYCSDCEDYNYFMVTWNRNYDQIVFNLSDMED